MKFCFSTFASILNKCKSFDTTQLQLGQSLLNLLHPDIPGPSYDDANISALFHGDNNVSPNDIRDANQSDPREISNRFKISIIPLLDNNKKNNIVMALMDVIGNDTSLAGDTIIELVNNLTKENVLKTQVVVYNDFLAGLFLYVLKQQNVGTRESANSITKEFIDGFTGKMSFSFVDRYDDKTDYFPDKSMNSGFNFDEETLEKARLFCIDNEERLTMLPICEMASLLNPKHKHISPIIDSFVRQNKKTQRAILITESIKPFELCDWDEINRCICDLDKEILEKKFSTRSFLYDGAKYFHKAFTDYAEFVPPCINPMMFKRVYPSPIMFKDTPCSLKHYLDEYTEAIENQECDITPPFDSLIEKFDFGNCPEVVLVFWINRFVISSCHSLHGSEFGKIIDEKWKYKDTVVESNLKNMEEMYYYALLLIYLSFGSEGI